MKYAYLFPGQGSQCRTMGKELFEKFPDLVSQADLQLGYSIETLCLKDPDKVLNKTAYTQPALYTVNALTYLDIVKNTGVKPDYLAGHSLGEYNALFAAGGFDFLTGLKLVQKRGELMSHAPRGAMAAIVDINQQDVQSILNELPYQNIDIANINSQKQCIISGIYEEIHACEQTFLDYGANFIHLNVSAAFHSRCMRDVQTEFAEFLSEFKLHPLQIPVIANFSARPYPKIPHEDYLVQQISNSVKWYESISWLLKHGDIEFKEVGPGEVLTKMLSFIKNAPMQIEDDPVKTGQETIELQQATTNNITSSGSYSNNVKPSSTTDSNEIIFMYSGQGSQYYQMGRELYDKNNVFRENMALCSKILFPHQDNKLAEIIYDDNHRKQSFDDITYTHPALFALEYSLTQVLIANNVKPTAVLGHSLGEYIAATIAGIISLEDGLKLVQQQAELLKNTCPLGGIISVIEDIDLYYQRPDIFAGTSLAGRNYSNCFFVAGLKESLLNVKDKLDQEDFFSVLLPVQYGFHSYAIDPLESCFKELVSVTPMMKSNMPLYSSVSSNVVQLSSSEQLSDHFWRVIRESINFEDLIEKNFDAQPNNKIFIDLSPTGTLSAFLKRGFGDNYQHYYSINQFGKNIDSIDQLLTSFSSIQYR